MKQPQNMRMGGEFGPDPEMLRLETKIDYDDLTIRSNCCSIYPNVLISRGYRRNFITVSSRLIAHELGHAFAQPHIYDNNKFEVNNSSFYIMVGRYIKGDFFHGINKRGGKIQRRNTYKKNQIDMLGIPDFINAVKEKEYDLNFANQIRNLQWQNDIFLCDLTTRESSPSYQH
ncbi:hypothetical protein HYT56_03605 [Candidatus Woesearchaeota archaeon]|nr:hypothetical protein [Candidatus Woesearchaeota archaeon]